MWARVHLARRYLSVKSASAYSESSEKRASSISLATELELPARWEQVGGTPNITATSLPDDYVHYSQPRTLTVRMHGRWMEWYENGVTSFQGHYRHGKKHGKWWEWYENGRMSTAGDFLDGYALDLTVWKPDGTLCPESGVSAGFGYWLSYEDNGDLKSRSEISNGDIDYELPDNFKDIEDDEDEGEEPF